MLKRPLVSLKAYLGDTVMAAPMFDALDGISEEVTVLAAPFVLPLLARPGRRLASIPAVKDRSPWAVFRQAATLRRGGFDSAILVNRSFRAAMTLRLAGIPVRIGHASEGRTFLITHPVAFDEKKFEAFCTLDLLRAVGISVTDERPRLHLSAEEREAGDRLREGATVALQPGARFPEKQLPEAVLLEVTRRIIDSGDRIVLLGGKEEADDAARLAEFFGNQVVNLVGRTNLRESLGVLAGCCACLGADTGVMHLAVGVGCPTVTVFGPTPVDKWGHAYEPHRVVRAPDGEMRRVVPDDVWKPFVEVRARS